MDILSIPFNKLIGIEISKDPNYLLTLPKCVKYENHIGTVHASALFTLAEATCAQFLILTFPMFLGVLVPIVRSTTVKYTKPAIGNINGNATLIEETKENIIALLQTKKRATMNLKAILYNDKDMEVMTAEFKWFVSKIEQKDI